MTPHQHLIIKHLIEDHLIKNYLVQLINKWGIIPQHYQLTPLNTKKEHTLKIFMITLYPTFNKKGLHITYCYKQTLNMQLTITKTITQKNHNFQKHDILTYTNNTYTKTKPNQKTTAMVHEILDKNTFTILNNNYEETQIDQTITCHIDIHNPNYEQQILQFIKECQTKHQPPTNETDPATPPTN